jgi:hypothetical protein
MTTILIGATFLVVGAVGTIAAIYLYLFIMYEIYGGGK